VSSLYAKNHFNTPVKDKLTGAAWKTCDAAVKAGLPPPPYLRKRSAKYRWRPNTRRDSGDTIAQAQAIVGAQSGITDKVFTAASRHPIITWLFWFFVWALVVVEARPLYKTFKHRRGSGITFFKSLVLIFAVIIMIETAMEQYRWVGLSKHEAEAAYGAYCRGLSVTAHVLTTHVLVVLMHDSPLRNHIHVSKLPSRCQGSPSQPRHPGPWKPKS
jgi:hypothetical protein